MHLLLNGKCIHACDKKDGSWKMGICKIQCTVHVHVQISNASIVHSLSNFSWNSYIYRTQGEVSIYRGGIKED